MLICRNVLSNNSDVGTGKLGIYIEDMAIEWDDFWLHLLYCVSGN